MQSDEGATARPVVFLGPTLPVEDGRRILSADYCPPAAQGAIVTAVQRFRPSAVLLIDGVFQGEPAVRHKELLWALAQGIPVFGAASMGALRAAELWRHGMIGVGLVFRWYRRFPLLPDDAVAVLHGPPELGFLPLTHALVDLRIAFRRAERSGVIDRPTRLRLDAAATSLNFRDRTLKASIERACAAGLRTSSAAALERALALAWVSQKRTDALTALRLVHRLQRDGALMPRNAVGFITTTAFLRDLRHGGINLTRNA